MITALTRQELIDDLKAYLTALDPAILVTTDTDVGIRIEMLADALLGQQTNLRSVEADLFPSPSCSTWALEKHAEARFGENPRKLPTTTDVIEDAFYATGTLGSVIEAGIVLVHADGTRYQSMTEKTIVNVGGQIFASLDIQSLDTGLVCNKETGDILSFEAPPSGLNGDGPLLKDLAGATDEETNAELLERLLDVIQNPHAGGRFSDYRQWACEHRKVRRAFAYGPSRNSSTGRRGLGCVDVAILSQGTGDERIPTAATASEVLNTIDAHRPAGMKGASVLIPAASYQWFDVRIEPEDGYEFDWTASATYTMIGYNPTTFEVHWNTTVPAEVVPGIRLCVNGQLCIVVSLPAADKTIIDRDIYPVGNTIYPGGPLTEPVQQVIRDHMDSLGPAKGNSYDPEQQNWEDSIKLSKLYRAIMGVTGVGDVSVVTPASNVTPTDHAPSGTTDLLCYWQRIIVREL